MASLLQRLHELTRFDSDEKPLLRNRAIMYSYNQRALLTLYFLKVNKTWNLSTRP